MPRKVKATVAPTLHEELNTPRASGMTCLANGNFGYKNIWGEAYLKFGVWCERPKEHEGKHAYVHKVRIAATNEHSGLNVDHDSVEVQDATFIILWRNKNDL